MSEPARQIAVEVLRWERRSIVLTAFGLVGLGWAIGASSVFYLYIRNKIESRFQLLAENIHELKVDIDDLRTSISKLRLAGAGLTPGETAVLIPTLEKKLSSDEDEYVTASESEEEEEGTETKIENAENEDQGAGDETSEQYQLSQFFARADALLEGGIEDQHEAYVMLKINKEKLQDNCEFWWRMTKATHMEGAAAGVAGNAEVRRAHVETAVTYAERAIRLNDQSSDAHKWYAIAVGNQSEFLGINDKIQIGYKFKQHVDQAVLLNPLDSTCYYLLGRFCLDVSQLSWIERKVASTLFSNPPTSTPKEALEYFKKCETLKPFLDNRYSMAKCYLAMGDNKQGAKWLDICASMPAESASDKATRQLVLQLLPKYKKYLT